MTDDSAGKGWYRQPWVWVLTIVPAGSLLGGLLLVWLAVTSPHDLQPDDRFERWAVKDEPVHPGRRPAPDEVLAELEQTEDLIVLRLLGISDSSVTLNLYHPDRRMPDQSVLLEPVGESGSRFSGRLKKQVTGPWRLELKGSEENWRLRGLAYLPAGDVLRMGGASRSDSPGR